MYTLTWSENQMTMTLNKSPTLAHHFIVSLILTTLRMILNYPQNGSLQGIFTWLLTDGQQKKTQSHQDTVA